MKIKTTSKRKKFIVKEDEKMVIAIGSPYPDAFEETDDGLIREALFRSSTERDVTNFKGIAKCHGSDKFDADKGKVVASTKADIKYQKNLLADYKGAKEALLKASREVDEKIREHEEKLKKFEEMLEEY